MVSSFNKIVRHVPAWTFYILLAIPGIFLTYGLFFGGLGPDPIRIYEHELGELALRFIILSLLITPLRDWFKINLIKYRRAIGLMAFYYVLAHLAAYVALDQGFDGSEIWKDITKRPYIILGVLATLILVPIAVTSNDRMIRKMGAMRWKRIHRGVYLAVILAMLHFFLLTKTIQTDQIIYASLIAVLLGYRAWKTYGKRRKAC